MDNIMQSWAAQYVGIPFIEKGRDRAGLDCWGLIRLVYAERFGHSLPMWLEGYSDTNPCEDTASHLTRCSAEFYEIPIGEERLGDILLFRTGRHLSHVGMVIGGGWMLHITAGIDSSVERYNSPRWTPRLAGIYRV